MAKQISLREFLIKSNTAGYASGDEKKWIKEKDGSTTISFKKGNWKSHDNFFGGEPYGGRIVVTKNKKPHWIMVYYGCVEKGIKPDLVYEVLRKALKNIPEKYPFRGPKKFVMKELVYNNKWKGDIKKFSGEEKIFKGKKSIYKAFYIGGLVDKRKGV